MSDKSHGEPFEMEIDYKKEALRLADFDTDAIEADKDSEELDMGVRYDIYISITHFSFFTKVETGLLMYPVMEDDRAHTGLAEVYGGTMAL